MPLTVEARERAVARVLEREAEGAPRAQAVRAVASQTGLSAAQVRRWVSAREPGSVPSAEGGLPVGGVEAAGALPRRSLELLRSAASGAAALAVGADVTVKFPLTTTSVVALLLLPVWLPVARRYRGATAVVVLGVAAVVAGWALAALSPDLTVDPKLAQATAVAVLSGVGAVGVLLWARSTLGLDTTALLVGLGMIAAVGVEGLSPINAWKYQLSLPVTTVVLALVARYRQPVLSATALLVLAVVGLASDSRSYAGFAVLTAAVVLWQVLPSAAAGRRRSAWQRVQLGALLAIGVSGAAAVGQQLLVGGALGAELAARSQAQVDAGGGSLLVGGRPEMQATLELLPVHPWGFGLGAVPDQSDVLLAKEGMARVGIQPQNGYVDVYMFGGHIELHSVLADLWASCGVVGAAFGLTMAVLLLDALLGDVGARRASALAVFWVASAVWFLGFGPLYTNLPDVAFALAVALVPAGGAGAAAGLLGQRRRRSTSSWVPRQAELTRNP